MKHKTTTSVAARPPLLPLPTGPGSTVRVPLERLAEWLAQTQAGAASRRRATTGCRSWC